MVKKNSSSKRWMHEHNNDEFVKLAKSDGYRGRAAYKLIEVIEKDKIIKANDIVLDLGAAPGSWSQVARKYSQNKVISSDIIPIEPITGVDSIIGDFTLDDTYNKLIQLIGDNQVNVVLSDMAPNMSGNPSVDIPKSMYLCELALDMATKVLINNGIFFIKVFQGPGFDYFLKDCKDRFSKVSIKKPKASRPRSKEVYILAKNLK